MKSANKLKQWLALLLCTLMAAGVLTQAAAAAEATGKCTNLINEGIEYYSQITVLGSAVNDWRQTLKVTARNEADTASLGTIVGMDIEVTNDMLRYSCTIDYRNAGGAGDPDQATYFSCNSVPNNATINGVYFFYIPNDIAAVGSSVRFNVEKALPGPDLDANGNLVADLLHSTFSTVTLPPYPCARNITTRNFEAAEGESLVLYGGGDCSCVNTNDNSCQARTLSQQIMPFYEKYEDPEKYAIVNIMVENGGDILMANTSPIGALNTNRIRMDVTSNAKDIVDFDFQIVLYFKYYDPTTGTWRNDASVTYQYVPETAFVCNGTIGTPNQCTAGTRVRSGVIATQNIDGITNANLPLILTGGDMRNVNTLVDNNGRNILDIQNVTQNGKTTTLWGSVGNNFPTNISFLISFWYENLSGTRDYWNSVFHFERNLNITLANECKNTGISNNVYDYCAGDFQGFVSQLPEPIVVPVGTTVFTASGTYTIPNHTSESAFYNQSNISYANPQNFNFLTRKCMDAACDWVTATNAYPVTLWVSDGNHVNFSYGVTGKYGFKMWPYGNNSENKPFAIKGVTFAADGPGTYVIYAFAKSTETNIIQPREGNYYAKFYVTVNDTEEVLNCYTLANNGYFKAIWDDCLSPSETQLIHFEQIPGKEEAWIRNDSPIGIDFPYNPSYSYLPQKLEIASLNCTFESLNAFGRPGEGQCNQFHVYVPPYTRVTIHGGTMYLEGYPKYDQYRAAYMREDTMNISHLFFSIQVKECEGKKIPDTGISLRSPMSPLKVNEKVNEATSYVFTGNSLRIPAIGLGMETPIPIVHVYYQEGSNGMVWDLSTLGNFAGELEGGSYIPYGGNSVLTGHYWSGGVFKNLVNLNYEDEIIIFANDGIKYTYKVVEKFIAQPDDVYEMFQQVGERSLTLVTCENYNLVTDEYERRYIVRAIIDSQEPYEVTW